MTRSRRRTTTGTSTGAARDLTTLGTTTTAVRTTAGVATAKCERALQWSATATAMARAGMAARGATSSVRCTGSAAPRWLRDIATTSVRRVRPAATAAAQIH